MGFAVYWKFFWVYSAELPFVFMKLYTESLLWLFDCLTACKWKNKLLNLSFEYSHLNTSIFYLYSFFFNNHWSGKYFSKG